MNLNQGSLDWLPFWQGIQDRPLRSKRLPFVLTQTDEGFLKQKTIPTEVIQNYASLDYGFITAPPGTSGWVERLNQQEYDFIKKNLPKNQKLSQICDIGGGNLFFGHALIKEFKCDQYTLIDPALKGVPQDPRFIFVKDYFRRGLISQNGFDFVLSLNCLEHVPDPIDFLQGIWDLLSPTHGRVVLTYPSIERPFKIGDYNVFLHEHLIYLTQKTSQHLFQSLGFEIEAFKEDSDKFFVLLKKTSHPPSRIKTTTQTAPYLLEKSFLQALDKTKLLLKNELSQDKEVYFYGATNGLNNILELLELAHHPKFYVVDGDQSKWGRFLPAILHPIGSPEELLTRKDGAVVISALSFLDEIKTNLIQRFAISPKRIYSVSISN